MAIRWTKKELTQLSNVFYNSGLEKAQIRDMSGAIADLKNCLQLNNNHTDARNLLGLIYYETGEMTDALAEWVISTNFQARSNPAVHYINKLQERREFLDEMVMASEKYNQALHLLREGADDLGVLLLKKVVELNPHFVRAWQLLCLVYMKKTQYAKSEKAIKKAMALDRTNTVSLRYYNELKRIAYARKKKHLEDLTTEDEISRYDGISADDVIIPTYHGDVLGGWRTVVNLLAGIVIGLTCFYLLVLPTKLKQITDDYNSQLVEANRSDNSQEAQVRGLTAQVDELTSKVEELTGQAQASEASKNALTTAYATLLHAFKLQLAGDYTGYLDTFSTIDVTGVTDESLLSAYEAMKTDVTTNAAPRLLQLGVDAMNAGDYAKAVTNLELCVKYEPNSPDGWVNLGIAYKRQGDSANAIRCLTECIDRFPGTGQAVTAQAERGY